MRIAFLVPHMFMQDRYLKDVIFSPGTIAIDLVVALADLGHEVTLFSPGKVYLDSRVKNFMGDFSLIDKELNSQGYTLQTLMSKHPLTYITLSRQIQSELISKAYEMANKGEFDVVHVWINEEDIALEFAKFCKVPIFFTHHEPFNYLTRYRTSFEKYKDFNWISISYSQRKTIGVDMNWVGNVYHGLRAMSDGQGAEEDQNYFLYLGRIIEPKGVHLAIKAVKEYNKSHSVSPIALKIAGKHYSSDDQNSYWEKKIEPFVDDKEIKYVGFVNDIKEKFSLLKNAKALIVPSIWDEPFGMITIEAFSIGTPVIGSNCGATPELIIPGYNGEIFNVQKNTTGNIDEQVTVINLINSLEKVVSINRKSVIDSFKVKYTVSRAALNYQKIYMQAL